MRNRNFAAAAIGSAVLLTVATYTSLTTRSEEAGHETQTLGGGPTIGYDSFAVRASGFDGVAVVSIAALGEPEWNTVDGARPSDQALAAAMSGVTQFDYFIGRPVTLELVRMIRGTWTAPETSTVWWRAGGEVGGDSIVIDDLRPPEPKVGQVAVAFTFDAPRMPTPGVALYVAEVYPVQADGRLLTPLASEAISLDDVPMLLARDR